MCTGMYKYVSVYSPLGGWEKILSSVQIYLIGFQENLESIVIYSEALMIREISP